MFIIYLLFLGSSIFQTGGLLQDGAVFSTSYPSPFTILALSPQTSLQSSDCYISYLACLSQLTTTSSVRLRSCVIPLTPLTMANFRQGRSVTLEDCASLRTPRRLGQRYYAEWEWRLEPCNRAFNVHSPSPLKFPLLTLRQPRFLINFCERSIQLCRLLLPRVRTPGTSILLSLLIYPRRILDAIDLGYPTRSSRKPDSSIHLRFPGIYVHNYSRLRPMCSTSGMRDTRPQRLDLSLAAIYDSAEEEGFRASSTRRRIRAKIK